MCFGDFSTGPRCDQQAPGARSPRAPPELLAPGLGDHGDGTARFDAGEQDGGMGRGGEEGPRRRAPSLFQQGSQFLHIFHPTFDELPTDLFFSIFAFQL